MNNNNNNKQATLSHIMGESSARNEAKRLARIRNRRKNEVKQYI